MKSSQFFFGVFLLLMSPFVVLAAGARDALQADNAQGLISEAESAWVVHPRKAPFPYVAYLPPASPLFDNKPAWWRLRRAPLLFLGPSPPVTDISPPHRYLLMFPRRSMPLGYAIPFGPGRHEPLLIFTPPRRY